MKEVIQKFVREELNGRYRSVVSDTFLEAYLEIKMTGFETERGLYNIGCLLFEVILEHRCGIPSNGHHVAQHFTDYIMKNRPLMVK